MKKIVLVFLIVLVVAAGCKLGKKTAVLYTDEDYKFKFTASEECEKYFSIKADESLAIVKAPPLNRYILSAPLSDWGNDTWVYYEVLTQEDYDAFPVDEPPGKPEVMLTLDSGELLVRWNPQDRPNDQPMECEFDKIIAEKI